MVTFNFNNKVALITGAASGIGLATARAFAESGAAVALADLDAAAVESAAKELVAAGHKAIGISCNVAIEAEVASMVQRVVSTFGGLDFAYNNAGMHIPVNETADVEGSDYDAILGVNLKGIWNCLKHELIYMRTQGSGAIVNCSSQSGLIGNTGISAYTASKHGVIGLTKSSALEYAPKGIRINAICPGAIDTPMIAKAVESSPEHMKAILSEIPLGRLGYPKEIASTVLWLCSSGAGFMIGQAVTPDGGYTVK
jgi:NAD(P)-dependent dehydrogenase (short-subunit alcohol dehydrogenase family)